MAGRYHENPFEEEEVNPFAVSVSSLSGVNRSMFDGSSVFFLAFNCLGM